MVRSALPLGLSKKSPRMPYRSLHALRLVEMTWGLRLIVGYVVIIAAALTRTCNLLITGAKVVR